MKSKINNYRNNYIKRSKTSVALLIVILVSISSFAQQGINYKAIVKNDLGNVIANEEITIQFRILDALSGGTILYQGTHENVMTDANGIAIVNIGEGAESLSYGAFSDLDWGSQVYYLEVGIDINGGNNFTDMGTTQFMSVPYAKYAERAANVATKLDDLTDAKSYAHNLSTYNGSTTFIGIDAGLNDAGLGNSGAALQNVGIGKDALKMNETGSRNTAVGYFALRSNLSVSNTAVGHRSLSANIGASSNTAIGEYAMENTTSGGANTVVGSDGLKTNTTGQRNTAIGRSAGHKNTTGSNNIFIGYYSGGVASTSGENNKLYINNETSNDPLIYGDFETDLIRINGTFEVTEEINTDVINTEEINTAATGNANMIPIAYGTVESNGNILSGTGNFTASVNSNVFSITVTGETLTASNSSCSIVPYSTSPRTSSIIHSGGDLRVYIFNSSGTQLASTFQFVIYKL